MGRFWTVMLATAPLWLALAFFLLGRWRIARERAGLAKPIGWRHFQLVGPEQPRGQAAIVSDDVEVGMDLTDGGDRWRVADVDSVAGRRRAWLVNLTDPDRAALNQARQREFAALLVAEVNGLVEEAVAPLWGEKVTADLPAIANHFVRTAIAKHADRLSWIHLGVRGAAELPDRALWPEVKLMNGRHLTWECRPFADALAARRPRI